MKKRVEELEVWQQAMALASAIYGVTSRGGFFRDQSLRDDMRSAATAVPAWIAAAFDAAESESRLDLGVSEASYSCCLLRVYLDVATDLEYLTEVESRALVDQTQQVRRGVVGVREAASHPPPTCDRSSDERDHVTRTP